jgi:hypothetical protein
MLLPDLSFTPPTGRMMGGLKALALSPAATQPFLSRNIMA